jgi:hypothetical protein
MTPLSDELLKRIVEGSGRVYTHEAKSMAHELIERRAKDKPQQPLPTPPTPYSVWGGTP